MLQWTGGSRRKVATSRKSTHSRQRQYFEQRKRQRQAPGQENHAKESGMEVLHKAEPRSLDILNLINLAVASPQASTGITVSENFDVAKVSNDSMLGKLTDSCATVCEGSRLAQMTKSSDSNLPKVFQTDSYKCAGHVNKWKTPESVTEQTSNCPVDRSNEKKAMPQIEATVLDLLDDGPYSNEKSIPEAHAALLVEGLGKIGSQTPAHSPRMQNRFSCKGIPMSSKASKRVCSSSALESSHNNLDVKLNAMIDDFRVSPLCNKSGSWGYIGTKMTTHISNVVPLPPYSHGDQKEEISINGEGFDACLLASNKKLSNDNFGYLEGQFFEENYDAAAHNQRLSFEGYPFLNSNPKMLEIYEASEMEVIDTFLGSSRNLWEGCEKFEASVASTPHFRRSTFKEEVNPSFIWDSCGTHSDEIFNTPTWSFLPTEEYQDNISLLSENSNLSSAVANKSSLSFRSNSTKPGKIKADSCEKFQKFSEGGSFMGICSPDKNIFTGFNDTVWEKKQNSNSSFKMFGDDDIFLPSQNFPSKTTSKLDPFNSFKMKKSTTSSGYKAMTEHEHFDLIPVPKSKFEIPSECEPSGEFAYQPEMFSKQSVFDFKSHTTTKPSSKDNGHSRYFLSEGDVSKEIHFTHLEDRGSSGKPQLKDAEKKSSSSGNAESAAAAESLGKVSKNEESNNEIPDCSLRVEVSNQEAEVIPTTLEEFPTQIQNYVRNQLDQFQKHSPVSSHPRNEESKATFEPETKKFQSEGDGDGGGDTTYQVMLQSYALHLLCVQKVLLEASEKDVKKA